MSDFGDNIISISDEDGNDFDLLILDEADVGDSHYLALTESMDPDSEENLEVIILKVITDEETGDDLLSTVDSEEELEQVYAVFEERMFSEDEDSWDEDEDDA